MKYDYLIVGSGLFGITFANLATSSGKKCLVIESRNHIGGNCYTENIEGINIHKYGAHIFHTNNKYVWEYVNKFTEFNNYINSPKAMSKNIMYSLPFNMNTFYELWGVTKPEEAISIINEQKFKGTPTNLEEQALSLVGHDIYHTLIKEYTEKQWGRKAIYLPTFIIKRLPLRYTFDNNYFNDRYQGIPIGGYTQMFENMIMGVDISLNTDYFSDKEYFNSLAPTIIYTGPIDKFFDYQHGKLEYRSLEFEHHLQDVSNYQGNAVINFCDSKYKYTRILEHKHFEKKQTDNTLITYEYPKEYKEGMIPYYPINDIKNQFTYKQYESEVKKMDNFIFGGRLSEYKYMDMHVVIESAMNKFNTHMIDRK